MRSLFTKANFMKKETIIVENLKCGGCAKTVTGKLKKFLAVEEVSVNLDHGEVVIQHNGTLDRSDFLHLLAKLGYPEMGTGNAMQKVKSFASCAVGRLS